MTAAAPAMSRPGEFTIARALPWLALAAFWLLATNYRGLYHDAVLYSIQALAHMRPELYSGDLFLSYGSQDRLTCFSAVYSLLAGWLGLENAAASITFLATLALELAALLLIRRLVPGSTALLGLAFVIALPNDYGPYGVFNVLEPFVTPRMTAEALSLFAVFAILAGRRVLAGALLVASASMHPLMAAPAVVIVAFLALPFGRRWYVPAAAGVGLVVLALIGSLPLVDVFRIDASWGQFFHDYARYLFASQWRLVDWMHVVPTVFTLVAGARVLADSAARQLCIAALFTAALGMAIMLIGGDWLRISLVVQGQGYRWLWPATLVALLILPAVAARLWERGCLARATLFALATVWIARDEPFAPTIVIIAIVVATMAVRDSLAPAHRRWVLWGTAFLFGLTACAALADRWLATASAYERTAAPAWFDQARGLFAGGLIPALLLVGVFALARAPARRVSHLAVALALLIACVTLAPVNGASWARRDFSAPIRAAFASWRALIPPRSDVVWIESPESAWLLLERPSYFSIRQSVTGVFSRAAALEVMARERQLIPFMKGNSLGEELFFVGEKRSAGINPARTLAEACNSIEGRYLVARARLEGPVLAEAPAALPASYHALRLYYCNPDHSAHSN